MTEFLSSVTDEERRWSAFSDYFNKEFVPTVLCSIEMNVKDYFKKLTSDIEESLGVKKEELFWENINGNENHDTFQSNDFNVSDEVSLIKLFLPPDMAKYIQDLDETLDASSILNILANVKRFPPEIRDLARKLKRGRIEWAHVHSNFSHWTETRYTYYFETMEKIVEQLAFPSTINKKDVLKQLKEWQTQGPRKVLCNNCVKEVPRLQKEIEVIKKKQKYLLDLLDYVYDAVRSDKKNEQHPSRTLGEIEICIRTAMEELAIKSYASGQDQSHPKSPDRQKEREKEEQKSGDDPRELEWPELTHSLDGATEEGDTAAATVKKEEEMGSEVKREQGQGDKKQEQQQKTEREEVGKGKEGPNVMVHVCNGHDGLQALVEQLNEESNQKSLINEIRFRREVNGAILSLRRDIQHLTEIELPLRNALDEQRNRNIFLAQPDRPNSKRPDVQKEREKERKKLADNPLSLPPNRGKTAAGPLEEDFGWLGHSFSLEETTEGGDTAAIAVKKEEEIRSEIKRKQGPGDKKQEQEQKADREEVEKGIEGPNLPGLCNGYKRLEALVQQQNEESNRKNLRNLMSLRYEVYVALQSLNRDIQHLAEISLDLKKEREKEQQEQADNTLAVQTPSDRPVKIAGDGGAGRGGEACGRKAGGKKNKKKKNSQHK